MNVVKRILTPPVFEDEIKTEQAHLLHVILWTLVCVPIPYVVFMFLKGTEYPYRALVQAGAGEFINIVLLIMLRRGYVRLTSVLQVSTFWLFFTATAITGSGIQGEAYLLGYGLVIAVAGMLLGGGGALIFTVLSLVSGWLMVHEPLQSLLNSGFRSTPLATWAISLVLFPVGAVLQHLASRTVKNSLRRARASEEKYRLISQVTSDYMFSTELDREGNMRLNWVAGAFESITGYCFDEYVASGGWRAHLWPDDLAEDDRAMDMLRRNQKVISEVRTYNKRGEVRWARVYAHPVWGESENRLIGIMGAVQDTTQQKQTEVALRNSEAIYRQAIEVSGAVPYHQTYQDHDIVTYDFIGEGIKDITGYSAAEFTEPLWDSLVIQRALLDDLTQYSWDDAIDRVRQGDYPIWKCEHRIRARDGTIHWVFEAAVELRDEKGVSHGSIGMFQDITEQKRTEEHRARRQVMLEKIVQLGKYVTEVNDLRTTLERIWHGVHDDLGFDRLAIFLYNRERHSFDGTLGTNKKGQMVEEGHLSFPLTEFATFNRVLNQPDGLYYTPHFSDDNKFPEDHEMYGVTDYAAVAAWAGNEPIAVICADNLMSQRSMDSEHLEALRLLAGYAGLAIENARLNISLQNELAHRQTFISELEAKNAELEQFTYTVSHDLKSPLVTINGFLGYLEKDALSGDMDRVKANVARISRASQKMNALLSDLLELSRVGRLMNPPEDVPFEEIVNEALERARGRIEANNIQVTVQENLPIIHGDKVRLIETIQNLLDNAAKFSAGTTDAWIKIGAAGLDNNQHHILFVCDNGMGIDPQFHERIFGLFNKLNPGIEGTGIGLTLVKRIIEVHGGRIWVDSQIGKGTSFYFTLPSQKN